jgi:hypothetical protein
MRPALLLVSSLVMFTAGSASAQQPPAPRMGPPVAGAVRSVGPGHVLVTTARGDVDLSVDARTHVLRREAATADEIKPGAYLGTSNLTAADGVSNAATEVHVMANGPNVHYAMDPSNPALMMTNGHVKSVKSTPQGEEMDVDYGGAAPRHVVVKRETPITHMADIGLNGLKPGMKVTARTTTGADGKPFAAFILVGEGK